MKQMYQYYFLIDEFTKTESQMIDLQKTIADISKAEGILKALDSCLISPKTAVIDRILEAAHVK
jgi:hypothetical protein